MVPKSRRDGIKKTAKCAFFYHNAIPTEFLNTLLIGLFFYHNAIPTEFYDFKNVNILH